MKGGELDALVANGERLGEDLRDGRLYHEREASQLVTALLSAIRELRARAEKAEAALRECESGVRSYLAHAGQGADHVFIVKTYLDPARAAQARP